MVDIIRSVSIPIRLSINRSTSCREQWLAFKSYVCSGRCCSGVSAVQSASRCQARRLLHSGLLLAAFKLRGGTIDHESSHSRFHIYVRSRVSEAERLSESFPLCHVTTSWVWGIMWQYSSSSSAFQSHQISGWVHLWGDTSLDVVIITCSGSVSLLAHCSCSSVSFFYFSWSHESWATVSWVSEPRAANSWDLNSGSVGYMLVLQAIWSHDFHLFETREVL